MRHRKTKREHGIVRKVMPNGTISEASYKDGLMHGLRRLTSPDQVKVSLMKNGQEVSYFIFNMKFKRTGAANYFDQPLYELNPDYFDPTSDKGELTLTGISNHEPAQLIDWVKVWHTITSSRKDMELYSRQIAELEANKASVKDNEHLQVQIESLDERIKTANVDAVAFEQKNFTNSVTEKLETWWRQIKKVIKNHEIEITNLKNRSQDPDETTGGFNILAKQSVSGNSELEPRVEALEDDFASFKLMQNGLNRRLATLENPEEGKERESSATLKPTNLQEVNQALEQIESRVEALEAFKYFDVTEYQKDKDHPSMSFGGKHSINRPQDESKLSFMK